MKRNILFIFLLLSCSWVSGQTQFKHIVNHPNISPQPFHPAQGLTSIQCEARIAGKFYQTPLPGIQSTNEAIESQKITSSGSVWINLHNNQLWSSRSSLNDLMSELYPNS